MKKGYIQIYTGDGKGKTTASLGLAVRAAGAGMNVLIAQFIKAMDTSEINIIKNIENINIIRYASNKKFVWNMTDEEKQNLKDEMQQQLQDAKKMAAEGKLDVVIFDELLGALHGDFVSKEEILDLIANKPEHCEYIITGRAAPNWLIKAADLVSEIKPVKHYMDAGIMARKGIEF